MPGFFLGTRASSYIKPKTIVKLSSFIALNWCMIISAKEVSQVLLKKSNIRNIIEFIFRNLFIRYAEQKAVKGFSKY